MSLEELLIRYQGISIYSKYINILLTKIYNFFQRKILISEVDKVGVWKLSSDCREKDIHNGSFHVNTAF